MYKSLSFACVMLLLTGVAVAQDAALSDAEVKARTLEIGKTLRCVVCQNQPISDSNSWLAEDMRERVEARVRLGETDAQVRAYMQSRYGDYVLMRPPVEPKTWALWFGPLLLIAIGLIWYVLRLRPNAKRDEAEEALSEAEQSALNDILGPTNDKASNS